MKWIIRELGNKFAICNLSSSNMMHYISSSIDIKHNIVFIIPPIITVYKWRQILFTYSRCTNTNDWWFGAFQNIRSEDDPLQILPTRVGYYVWIWKVSQNLSYSNVSKCKGLHGFTVRPLSKFAKEIKPILIIWVNK